MTLISNHTKHQLVINHIEEAMLNGVFQIGDRIPSINKLGEQLGMSRLTVRSAYKELISRGIISSSPGKGYFVTSDKYKIQQRIFVLFDELNAFKENLYNAFLKGLGKNVSTDVYFHHFKESVFKRLIKESIGKYTSYVIMPAKLSGIASTISLIPQGKLYLLDQDNPEIPPVYPLIYQNFEKTVFQGLQGCLAQLKKYNKIILAFTENSKEPNGILDGFLKFCKMHQFDYEVTNNIQQRNVSTGEAFFLTDDADLVHVILQSRASNLSIGQDLGIVSFNDTELKSVVDVGITVISTDFIEMGTILARMILNHEKERIENKSRLILRKSL